MQLSCGAAAIVLIMSQVCSIMQLILLAFVCLVFSRFRCEGINQQKVLMGHNICQKLASVISLPFKVIVLHCV